MASISAESGARYPQPSAFRTWSVRMRRWVGIGLWSCASLLTASAAQAQETVCARVKMEIRQELTLERQGFDAEMKIHNTTETGTIENVAVSIQVTDESGTPVKITYSANSDDPSVKFFVKLNNSPSDVDGSGSVPPKTTRTINWLLIPTPGSAGTNPFGTKYLVGATLKYRFQAEDTELVVSPDVITVKPMPKVALDYFLPDYVWADDPLTDAIEPPEPFTLGVRVKNNGLGMARNLAIDSVQPKIVENEQSLLFDAKITGSYVDDAPAQNSLLINFGDIASGGSKMGRWIMTTSKAGRFTEFTAKMSHADELGGTVTSILDDPVTHRLLHDVRVDLPRRDSIRDFLAKDGVNIYRVYESDGDDTLVNDRSSAAVLTPGSCNTTDVNFQLTFNDTNGSTITYVDGFSYAKVTDPCKGKKVLGPVIRSDSKAVAPENVWLSKTFEEGGTIKYWINIFDFNSTGTYYTQLQEPPPARHAPEFEFIPDRVTRETVQVSFLVEASSPDGFPLTLVAEGLPAGASFTPQPVNPENPQPGKTTYVFDWTPAKGTAGRYTIVYVASDGVLSTRRSAAIEVMPADGSSSGPATPSIVSPLSGAQVTSLRPTLKVQTSLDPDDPSTAVNFELYFDEPSPRLVSSMQVTKAVQGETVWAVPENLLQDNTRYRWRARTFGESSYSVWADAHFFVNLFNDPPENFNLGQPTPGSEVDSLTPELNWSNSDDKDGDVVTYKVTVYRNEDLSEVAAESSGITAGGNGSTSWKVSPPLKNHTDYYWRVTASDAVGAQTTTAVRRFTVNTGNTAPTPPNLSSPEIGGQATDPNPLLTIRNSVDADNDLITYIFEMDTDPSFNTENKRSSGQVIQMGDENGTTSWNATQLTENTRYWWRVKAEDGLTSSVWMLGDFRMNSVNESPSAPSIFNPGNGAWINTLTPTLLSDPVVDPEEEEVRYEFEIYSDAGLTQLVAKNIGNNPTWTVPVELADRTTYRWRVRAIDNHETASGWSPPIVLYVSTGGYQVPIIAVTEPAIPTAPNIVETAAGIRKEIMLRWDGTDLNIEPTVSLYYSTESSGFNGTLITGALNKNAGTHGGTYVWDVTKLVPGTYYVYGVISDPKGESKAYAPGAVVIPPPAQAGIIQIMAGSELRTAEDGLSENFNIRLGYAPTADVVIPLSSTNPREGTVSPPSLTFTPQNWNIAQTVTVTGQNDCAPDGDSVFQVRSGKIQSLDPEYFGLMGDPVDVLNQDSTDFPNSTDNPQLHVCGLTVVSVVQTSGGAWEYALKGELTNLGTSLGQGAVATLRIAPAGLQVVEGKLVFGAISEGETVKTSDTVTVRSRARLPEAIIKQSIGFKWNVNVEGQP